MNVTASKLLLIVSLAAYTYMSWDHLTYEHHKPKLHIEGATKHAPESAPVSPG